MVINGKSFSSDEVRVLDIIEKKENLELVVSIENRASISSR